MIAVRPVIVDDGGFFQADLSQFLRIVENSLAKKGNLATPPKPLRK